VEFDEIPTLAQLRAQLGDNTDALEQAARDAAALHLSALQSIGSEAGQRDLNASQQARWNKHCEAESALTDHVNKTRLARVTASRSTYGATMLGSTPSFGSSPMVGRARATLDTSVRSGVVNAAAAEKMTRMLDSADVNERDSAASWLSVAGAPEYLSAFSKIVADPVRGHLAWTGQEQEAYRAVAAWRESREVRTALATTGYVLPVGLDPFVVIANAGSASPLRELAEVVTTATDTYRKIKSSGATAEWKVEGVQAADGTPGATEVEIALFSATCDATFSYEVQRSALDLVDQLGRVIADAILMQLNVAYVTGNGTTAPQGLVTGLAGTASEINTTGSETYDKTDPTRMQAALGARYSPRAVFLSHIATKNAYAFMETTNGALLFPELRQDPAHLLGKPWFEVSDMDGAINAAATANNFVMAYGDIRAAYTIVDQVGATVEILPGFGANGRPTGQRHLFSFSRHGAKVVDSGAAVLLDIPTTA